MEMQVEQFIHGLSDLDLLEYTRHTEHLPESLEFARVEMADRRLSVARIAQLNEQLRQREEVRRQAAEARAAEPLLWKYRVCVFLCGLYFGLPLICFYHTWRRFRDEGYTRKYKEMWVSALVGFCLQPILVFLRVPPWSWLAGLLLGES